MKVNIFAIIVVFCYAIVNANADVQFLKQNNNSLIDKNNGSSIHKNDFFSATSNLLQSFYEKLSKIEIFVYLI
jgi:hypothetical protein